MSFEVIRGHSRSMAPGTGLLSATGRNGSCCQGYELGFVAVNLTLMKKNLLGYTSKKYTILITILR